MAVDDEQDNKMPGPQACFAPSPISGQISGDGEPPAIHFNRRVHRSAYNIPENPHCPGESSGKCLAHLSWIKLKMMLIKIFRTRKAKGKQS